jgi:hypothetical protein
LILQGSIPEKLLIIERDPIKVGLNWDDLEEDEENGTEVRPAFVSDAANAKTVETGRAWAEGGFWAKNKKKPFETEIPNKPRSGYRVVSLEKRSEGGRAWKVISPDGYWFDLREDVLLDTLLESGVKKGGELQGSFIWARVRAEMKLVRVGSRLHAAMVEATSRRTLKKIGLKDLEHGGVYRFRNGQTGVFCGWVSTVTYMVEGDTYYNRTRTLVKKAEPKTMLWFRVDAADWKKATNIAKRLRSESQSLYFLTLRSSHTAVEKIGQVKAPYEEILEAAREGSAEWREKVGHSSGVAYQVLQSALENLSPVDQLKVSDFYVQLEKSKEFAGLRNI